ncbi:transglutaminase-like domain-containing protein [Candidatus Bipolaricaulota bacterium]
MRRLALGILLAAIIGGVATQAATITREYTWEYASRKWVLTHDFDLRAYSQFRSLPRVSHYTDYGDYVLDPGNDEMIAGLVEDLEGLAQAAGLDVWEKLHLIVSFVQSLRYVSEEAEYPRYPIETLVEGCGDCEDLAILTAAILRQMGFGVVLLAFTAEMHMAVGIRILPPDPGEAHAYAWNGDTYYYLETTGTGWTIGEMPTEYTSIPTIIALSSPTS